jgi:hypothetical protein
MPTKLRSIQFVKKQQTSIAKSNRKFPNSSSKILLGDRAKIIGKKQEHKKHISKHSTKRNIKLVSSAKKDGNLKKRKTDY